MHIYKNNPFYLKFFTSIEGYLHLFLSPILIFYVTKDIKLSGLFFLIDNLCKFSTYSFSGSLITQESINSIIKFSYGLRFIFVIMGLIVFYFIPENQFTLLVVNNLGFTICNAFYVTSIETLFQNHKLFDKNIQAKLTAGDLWSGGVAVMIILLFTSLKITFDWLIPIMFISFGCGLLALHHLVEALNKLKKVELKRFLQKSVKEFNQTLSFVFKNHEMRQNMMIGYVPFAFFLVVEQVNIFRFNHSYDDFTMKVLHYSFKSVWFVSGAILVPFLVKKSKEISQVFTLGTYAFLLGGLCSLVPGVTSLNLLGALLLGYSHNLIFVYRKINRRRILDAANLGFQSLGVFFAIEGLSGVIAYMYLSVMGLNTAVLVGTFLASGLYLWFKKDQVHQLHQVVPEPPETLVLVGEAERRAEAEI